MVMESAWFGGSANDSRNHLHQPSVPKLTTRRGTARGSVHPPSTSTRCIPPSAFDPRIDQRSGNHARKARHRSHGSGENQTAGRSSMIFFNTDRRALGASSGGTPVDAVVRSVVRFPDTLSPDDSRFRGRNRHRLSDEILSPNALSFLILLTRMVASSRRWA